MKTDEILHIDCRTEEGFQKLQKFLLKVPPIKKKYEKISVDEKTLWRNIGVPIDVLEKTLHMLNIKKGYQIMNIQPFYGKKHDEFVFYTASAKRVGGFVEDHVWVGNVYGRDLYETVAKLIIMIYADMKKVEHEHEH